MRDEKNELLKQIRENPIFVSNKEKYVAQKRKVRTAKIIQNQWKTTFQNKILKERKNNAAKLIQKVYRNILAKTKQYTVHLILYRTVSLDDPQLYEGIEKGNIEAVKEIYRRKK